MNEVRENHTVSISKSLSGREKNTLLNILKNYIADYEGINRDADVSCKATGCPCEADV